MNKKGITLLEVLMVTIIFSMLILFSASGLKSFFSALRIHNGISTVTTALNSARYKAIKLNKPVRVSVRSKKIVLEIKTNNQWQKHTDFDPGDKLILSINSKPVFYPTGMVVPLCSVMLQGDIHRYKISISLAGRIKVVRF